MNPTLSNPNQDASSGTRSLLAWVTGSTFVAGVLAGMVRGSNPEESLAASMIRAWVAGELAVVWLRWVRRQPAQPARSKTDDTPAPDPGREGAG